MINKRMRYLASKFREPSYVNFTFNDVNIVPVYSKIKSRDDVDNSIDIANSHLGIPIIAANMDTVSSPRMVKAMREAGGMAILPRANIKQAIKNIKETIKLSTSGDLVSFSIGTKESEENLTKIYDIIQKNEELKFLLMVEVAHAHHESVYNTFKLLNKLGFYDISNLSLGAGNIATYEAARFLYKSCNINIMKCGISSGSHCSTAIMTGCGVPMISSIMDVSTIKEENPEIKIIGDGGFQTPGDIAKAIVAGADAVMLGRMLAGCIETPGSVFYDSKTDRQFKLYRGSASRSYKTSQGTTIKNIEGVSSTIEVKGTVLETLDKISEGLRSAMAYCDATTIKEFQENGKFVKVTDQGYVKNLPQGIL